ncbi:ATP-binding protein [Salinisphaera sp. G21_0]|uniref:ATP-binding protein n=1 Tax=Salinisphaera sp. G21_0 TaxID=2821094 RepID=UPI001AD9BB1C|nr:ATP-binding protein [Salinisphaera sp. G21_0]MBO9483445.1 ATP-binding protein [Salinisphaera sp. G21_0]
MNSNSTIYDGSLSARTLWYLNKIRTSQESLSSSVSALKRHAEQLPGEQRLNLVKKIKSDKRPGWLVDLKLSERQLQFKSILLEPFILNLSKIGKVTIADNDSLSDFLNEHVVTPFKHQESYAHFAPADQPEGLVLLGSDNNSRQEIINKLQDTLGNPVYQLTEINKGSAIDQMILQIKEDGLSYAVIAIEVDCCNDSCIQTLLNQLRSKLKHNNINAVVMVMASREEQIPELLLDKQFKCYRFNQQNHWSPQEKVALQILASINQYIRGHKYSVNDNVDWKQVADQLSDRIPEGVSDIDRKDKCRKVVNEFFIKVGQACARAGLFEIDQKIIDQCITQRLNKEVEPLGKKLEDFILHGQPELTQFFRNHVIQQLLKPEFYELYNLYFPQSFLLYGIPGTGKTRGLKALANFLDLAFYEMNPKTVGSCFVDECEQNIADMFEKACEAKGAIIMIDEIDSMLPKRNGSSHFNVKRTNELLRHIEAANENRIIVAGTTNRPNALDPAALRKGRLGTQFEVKGLNQTGIEELLTHQLQRFMDKDKILELTPAVNYLGDNCLVSDVYDFCNDLCSFAAKKEVHPLNQQILNQYISEKTDKIMCNAHENPVTSPPPSKPGKYNLRSKKSFLSILSTEGALFG